MKTIICLGGGIESVPIIERVVEMGHKAVVVDGSPDAPALNMAPSPNIERVVASCYHGDQAIAALKKTGIRFDGVLCCGVDAPMAAAVIASEFRLAGLSPTAARFGVNKYDQKKRLGSEGIAVPKFAIADSGWQKKINGVAVLKPVDSRGGRGVIRILQDENPEVAYTLSRNKSPSETVMVEEWIDGVQLSTESIIINGKCIFTAIGKRNYDRLLQFAPYCIEDGFDAPFTVEADIDGLIEQSCAALGWDNLTVKGDLVVNRKGKVFVIELAPRLSGGFFATHGHYYAYGVDFVGEAINLALGHSIDKVATYHRRYVSQRYVFPERGEIGRRVKEVRAPDVSFVDDGYVFTTWNIRAGDLIKAVDCHPARWGQVLVAHESEEGARYTADTVVEVMKEAVELF